MSVSTITIAAILATGAAIPCGDLSDLPENAAIEDKRALAATFLSPPEETQPFDSGVESSPDAAQQAPDPGVPVNEDAAVGQPVVDADEMNADSQGILVVGEAGPPPGDPLENVNVQSFEVVQAVDKALVEPVTAGYINVLPKPVRDGLHNAVTNLDEPLVFLSFLLQLKPLKALATAGRFAVNSTIGLGGLIDVAKREPFNHPHQRNGLGHTLAYYGVGPGPFLYLPLIGSTTVRDLSGTLAAMPLLPLTIGKPFNNPAYVIPKAALSALDDRAQDNERLTKIHSESSNPYPVYRSYYLRKHQAEVDMIRGLRDNAEVPVFEDESPDIEDAPHVDKGAALDAGGHLSVDR